MRTFILITSLLFGVIAQAEQEYLQSTVVEAYVEMRTSPGRGYPVFYIAERGELIARDVAVHADHRGARRPDDGRYRRS